MDKESIITLYDYNYWANRLVLNAAAQVTVEQFVAPAPVSHGSLRGALVHVLAAEVVWRLRCAEGVSPGALPAESDFASLPVLQRRWQEEERLMRHYVAGLTSAALRRPLQYTTTAGVAHSNTLWHLLAHVVNHGTQFRAEAAVLLSSHGHSPGDLDLLRYIRLRDV